MKVVAGDMPIADLLEGLERGAISVNHTYQRQSKVWPPSAQASLIETILLGYPITKFSMHQQTDILSRVSTKDIVDGQQRTAAIHAFANGEVALPRSSDIEEARGLRFKQLSATLQQEFMEYALDIDLFVGTTPEQVREVFRRINSYTVPLNAEEQRHARFQGEFKWFVHRTASHVSSSLKMLGTFSERQLVRMADAKLLTEMFDAMVNGISTTNKRKLDGLYKRFDDAMPSSPRLEGRIERAIDWLTKVEVVPGSELAKPHQMYSLVLAVAHSQDSIPALLVEPARKLDQVAAAAGLGALIDDLENERDTEFVGASEKATNTGENRARRFRAYVSALGGN